MRKQLNVCMVIVTLGLASGCGGYTQSKIDLTTQAQRGLVRVREALVARAADVDESSRLLRQRLDAAFDQDVVARPDGTITPDWVITHRKAYAAAIEMAQAQHGRARAADAAMLGTIDAVALALSQLQQMHASEMRLTLPEVK